MEPLNELGYMTQKWFEFVESALLPSGVNPSTDFTPLRAAYYQGAMQAATLCFHMAVYTQTIDFMLRRFDPLAIVQRLDRFGKDLDVVNEAVLLDLLSLNEDERDTGV